MDIYKPYFNKNTTNKQLVTVGRITVLIALILAVSVANTMGSIPQMFQYIQEYTGLMSPGILGVFLMGLFWKKTSVKGAIAGLLSSIPVALILKFLPVAMPFLDQMLYTLLLTIIIIMGVSLRSGKLDDDPKAIPLHGVNFITGRSFNISTYVLLIILVILYIVFW